LPGMVRKISENKLTAMMIVRNEANRYLKDVLDHLTAFVDYIIILDDASTDETPEICASYQKVILHRNEESLFYQHEARLRARLWELTAESGPDWILAVDADEIFEDRIQNEIKSLIDQVDFDGVEFRMFDFWKSATHYRVDGFWNPWPRFSLLLARYFPEIEYTWPDLPFHSGRWPVFYRGGNFITFQSDIRVKHYGWARGEEHKEKYLAYKAADPEGKYSSREHLESVLAPQNAVKLEDWIEAKTLPF